MESVKDKFGNSFRVDDEVVYPTRQGSWMELKKGKVLNLVKREVGRFWNTKEKFVPEVLGDGCERSGFPEPSRMVNLTYYAEQIIKKNIANDVLTVNLKKMVKKR